jgi:hypothetical protein
MIGKRFVHTVKPRPPHVRTSTIQEAPLVPPSFLRVLAKDDVEVRDGEPALDAASPTRPFVRFRNLDMPSMCTLQDTKVCAAF